MTDAEALKLALSKEENSIRLYKKMLARYSNLKDLLSSLLTEEQKHKKLIEERIVSLTGINGV